MMTVDQMFDHLIGIINAQGGFRDAGSVQVSIMVLNRKLIDLDDAPNSDAMEKLRKALLLVLEMLETWNPADVDDEYREIFLKK
jgi:hypothetical protein